MSRLARPAARIAAGSSALARRLGARAAAWCARGRRDDLTGWRAALGVLLRIVLLIFGAYLLARLVRALPAVMWLLSTGWTVAAWRAGRPAADEPAETSVETPPTLDRDAVQTLLLEAMGDAPAVHLRTVLAHLQERGQWEGRKVADLRAALARLDIPHARGVKVAGVPTWGVRRRDLQAPSPTEGQETSTAASTAA
ncbi:hypothetical protein ACIRPR_06480 [Streptomyces griseoflavus]|uniref:hypothetical protein n=1 Tax=Streptomyces griseoflavus TaxID=35619 RepID=UPI0037F18238